MKNLLIIALLILISPLLAPLNAQEHSGKHTSASEHFSHKNDIAGFAGGTYIIESGFFLPTFGIEYVRKINSYFGVGVITEIELGSHIISTDEDTHEQKEVNRESAFLVLPALYFKAGNFVTSIGYGIEFEKNENLGLLKLSAMYVLELKNDKWIVIPSISWDHTDKFNGLVYGVSLARRF
jgi:hypothetical protein